MEPLLKSFAEGVALACELGAVLFVAIGAAEAVVRAVMSGRAFLEPTGKRQIWVRFAAWIALSLEFALAADIARTAIAPTWDDIGRLAAIAAIRTALNLFLERDLEAAQSVGEKRDA